jgi:hypothetical protein
LKLARLELDPSRQNNPSMLGIERDQTQAALSASLRTATGNKQTIPGPPTLKVAKPSMTLFPKEKHRAATKKWLWESIPQALPKTLESPQVLA